jgi:hypothetical protein
MNKIKNKIQEIINQIPIGIKFKYIQTHLEAAISEINRLEKQELRIKKSEKIKLEKNATNTKNLLDKIESMIQQEIKKE